MTPLSIIVTILMVVIILAVSIMVLFNMGCISSVVYSNLLFWLACIPVRSTVVYAASQKMKYTPYLTGLFSIGFLQTFAREQYRMYNGGLANDGKLGYGAGPITGMPVYWHDKRLIHGVLYGLYTLLHKYENSHFILLADLFVGMSTNVLNNIPR
jgi:hypothetical protein